MFICEIFLHICNKYIIAYRDKFSLPKIWVSIVIWVDHDSKNFAEKMLCLGHSPTYKRKVNLMVKVYKWLHELKRLFRRPWCQLKRLKQWYKNITLKAYTFKYQKNEQDLMKRRNIIEVFALGIKPHSWNIMLQGSKEDGYIF